jgi:hypothetical protein
MVGVGGNARVRFMVVLGREIGSSDMVACVLVIW